MANELVRRFQLREKEVAPHRRRAVGHARGVAASAGPAEEASALVHDNASRPRTEGTVPVNLSIAAFGMAR